MSTLQFFHPADAEEAQALLAASSMPVDSRTQRRIRTDENLSEYLASGRRRPEWVWGVRHVSNGGGIGEPLGVVGAFGAESVFLLDLFGVPEDPEVARALMARVTADASAGHAETEVCLFAPPGSTVEDADLAPVVDPLRAAGWRMLVERRHYEFEPPPRFAADESTALRFERLRDADDPRLIACHREVMRDTLDAHDAALIDRLGFDEACRESLAFLLDADPVECLHLALDESEVVVGMVSGRVSPGRRGVVLFVGVPATARGQGYGRELLGWQTQQLLAQGAGTLIADTDNENVPMARAFAAVGWEQTETRIDMVLGD